MCPELTGAVLKPRVSSNKAEPLHEMLHVHAIYIGAFVESEEWIC